MQWASAQKWKFTLGGVAIRCLLDTGSNVSTLTESFFKEHLHGEDKDLHCTNKWLKITAANGLPLPYLGYVELDIQVMGLTIPGCGFLVIRDQNDGETDSAPPGILGMNVAQRCKQLILAAFDHALEGTLDADWRAVLNRVQEAAPVGANSMVRVAGTRKLYVPAASVATIQARTHKEVAGNRGLSLFEPGKASLPGGLVLVPTLVLPGRRVFPVQVVNVSPEGVWLPPKAKLGVLAQGRRVESSSCEVRFIKSLQIMRRLGLTRGQ